MAMFHLEAVFLLELALFAAGLVLLHLARTGSAALLRAAGLVLVVGAVLSSACTLYYGIRYHVQGEFESAYPPHSAMMGTGRAHGHPHTPRGVGPRHEPEPGPTPGPGGPSRPEAPAQPEGEAGSSRAP